MENYAEVFEKLIPGLLNIFQEEHKPPNQMSILLSL